MTLREKAERLIARRELSCGEKTCDECNDDADDAVLIAEAYLDTIPEDAELEVTEEWLRSIGCTNRRFYGQGIEVRPVAVNRFFDGIEIWQDDQGVLAVFRKDGITRSDVLALLRALGIQTKGE